MHMQGCRGKRTLNRANRSVQGLGSVRTVGGQLETIASDLPGKVASDLSEKVASDLVGKVASDLAESLLRPAAKHRRKPQTLCFPIVFSQSRVPQTSLRLGRKAFLRLSGKRILRLDGFFSLRPRRKSPHRPARSVCRMTPWSVVCLSQAVLGYRKGEWAATGTEALNCAFSL